jgi:hypothetical protein
MSIYPVRCKTWFVYRKVYNDPDAKKDIALQRSIIKGVLQNKRLKCSTCGKPVTNYDTAYVSHAFVYGFDDTNFCNKKCYDKRFNHLTQSGKEIR